MATDRSTDDYKQILLATIGSLLQHPTPQNKMGILAADAVKIADLVVAELDKVQKAEAEKDKKAEEEKDRAEDEAKDKDDKAEPKAPGLPPPPTSKPAPAPGK